MSSVATGERGGPGVGAPRTPAGSSRVLYAPREPLPPGPDAAADVGRYRAWIAGRLATRALRPTPAGADEGTRLAFLMVLAAAEGSPGGHGPDGAVTASVANPVASLAASLTALGRQTDAGWELTVATIGSPGPALGAVLADELAHLGSARARQTPLGPGHCAAAGAAAALAGTTAPFVVLLGPGDRLAPDAVAMLRRALGTPDVDVAYGDDDRLDVFGDRGSPSLKPDWSPERLLVSNYLGRPVALRRSTVEAAGGITEVEGGDWEHDLLLRTTEVARRVAHVAEVLGGRAGDVGRGRDDPAGPGAVVRALARRGETATVEPGPVPGHWRLRRRAAPVRASAVVPLRDEPRLLRAFVDSVRATTDGSSLQLVLVDNGSQDPETLSLLDRLDGAPDTVVVRDSRPFNWAAHNNAALGAATGDVLIFMNNDIEARTGGWLEALCAQATRADVGAVGARLSYPGGRLQHAGVVVGLGGAAGHVLAGLGGGEPGYLGMALTTRECSAVTGACLATRRDVFEALGGFDEDLGLDLNDVDYCLRAGRAGYRVLYEAQAELVHHESPSRGTSQSVADISRFLRRWDDLLAAGDPFFNPNLTRTDASCALREADEEERWRTWRSTTLQGA